MLNIYSCLLEELEKIKIPVGRAKDLTNQRFGKLMVLFRVDIGKEKACWACQCDCGNYCISHADSLLRQGKTSCIKCKTSLEERLWNIDKMNQYCEEYAIGYKVLDVRERFFNNKSHLDVLIKCPNELHEPYWTLWDNFHKKGARCKQCFYERKNKIMWNIEKAQVLFEQNGLTILDVSQYQNANSKLLCINNEGYLYTFSVYSMMAALQKFGKVSTHLTLPSNSDEYNLYNINHYCEMYKPEYRIVSKEYHGIDYIYTFIYLGNDLPNTSSPYFECNLNHFLYANVGHPDLTISKGEGRVKRYLEYNNYLFVPQKQFLDCIDQNPLPFDFYIPALRIAIEYQGRQHYEAIDYFGGQDGLEYIQRHDKIKADYCHTHGIKLITIPYWEYDNIEKILDCELRDIEDYFEDSILDTELEYIDLYE